jgi:hypothetical protein
MEGRPPVVVLLVNHLRIALEYAVNDLDRTPTQSQVERVPALVVPRA